MKSNQTNNRATAYGRWLICASFILLGALNLRATDGTWTSTANGNWSDTTKWSGGTVADGANGLGSTAFFNTLNLTADTTVTLDSVRTNGNLVFADTDTNSAANWILSGNKLFLSGANPTITVTNLGAANKVTISTILAGTNGFATSGLAVNGNSRLDLTGVNIFTNLLVNGASLAVNVAQSPGANVTNNVVTLTNGATLLIGGSTTWLQTLNVKGSNTFLRLSAGGGNWNGMFVGDGILDVNLAGVQMTFGGGNIWNSNLFANFTGTMILDGGGNFRFDENNAATTTFGSKFATFDLGTTNNSMNERGAAGIATHTTFIGALKGGVATAMACNGTAGTTNTFQIGDANLDTTFFGRINNGTPTSVTKSGTGTLTLAGTNGYSGITTVQNGRLALATTGFINSSPVIKAVSPGIFDVSAFGLWTNSPSLKSIQGNGVITGAVALTSCNISPGIAANDTATLTFASDLTLSNTVTLHDTVAPTAVDKIFVNGNLNLYGTNIVQLIPTLGNVIVTNGTYVLFQWTGALTGDVTNLVLSLPFQLGTTTLATNASQQIILTVAGAQLVELTWRGDQGPDWSTANNWRDTNGNPASWADGRVAHFDESASAKNVAISASVNPARILFSNTSTYDFTGGGKITGSGVMVKDGIGRVIFETGNDYSGSTTISNGVIQIGNNNTSGSLGSGQLIDHGTIAFNRTDGVTYGASISGAGGMIVGAGTVILTASSSYTGDTVVSNSAVLQLGTGLPVNNGSLLGTIQVNSNATVHYFFDASAQIINNNLSGSGAVIYEVNQNGTPTGPRNVQFGLTVTNTGFVGFVDIKGGTRLEIPTAAGMLGTNILVEYDSTFNVGGAIYAHGGAVTNTATLSIIGQGPGTGVDTPRGMGALRLNNGWSGNITLGGPDTFGNPTSIGGASGTGTIIGNISDNGNNYMLEYFNGAINVGPASGVNSYGATRISEGRSGAAPGTSAATTVMAINSNALSTNGLEMSGQAVFRLNGNNITVANLNSRSGDNTDASIICSNYIPVIQNFSTTTSATLTVGVDGNSQQFDGIFGDGASQPLGLTKVGAGTLTLSGDSTNHGVVTVSQGTLALISADAIAYNGVLPKHGSGSFSNATQIAIASGATLDVTGRADNSGTLTLQNGQTLKGNGTLNGKLIASAGSIINPGSSVGTLTVSGNVTLNGTLWLELNRTNSPLTYDRLLSSGGSITYGGTLLATNIGPVLQTNDTFQLFPSGNAGFALKTLVTTDANGVIYTWQDNINTLGSIKVVGISPGVNTTPTNITFKVNGGNLELSWPADHTGWTLQSQTNSTSIGLTTNWVDMNGSAAVNSVTNAVNAGNGAVFYRMKYP